MVDLALYRDVVRRHRWLVLLGVVSTLGLAVLSFVSVSPSGLAYRTPQIWSNEATLVLSQRGFPEGRFSLPPTTPPEQRLAALAELYATLATSDAVVAPLMKKGLIEPDDLEGGELPFAAAAVPAAAGGVSPVMKITGTGETRREATTLTVAATKAFVAFLSARQTAAGIREDARVQLRVVKRSGEPVVLKPRSKTPLIFILFAGLTLTFTTAFLRDNAQRKPQEERIEVAPTPLVDELSALSERLASSGLRLASASQGMPDSGSSPAGRHSERSPALALLDELWPKLRAEGIALVLVRYHGDGAERTSDAIACYATLPREGNATPVTPSHELATELSQFAYGLRATAIESRAHGNGGIGTLILDVGEQKATFHHGWYEPNEANGTSRLSSVSPRRSSTQTPH